MGYDISWHPISEAQMHQWYFDAMENMDLVDGIHVRVPDNQLEDETEREETEAFYVDKYKETLETAKTFEGNFSKTHAYIIAVVQGFFEVFFYTRGSAISFIEEEDFGERYVTSWRHIAPEKYLEHFEYDGLDENYSGGVYLSPSQVARLLFDYENDARTKSVLDQMFSHGRIDIFLKALNFAKEKGLGLLEATEVIEPHPQLGGTHDCYCNVFNCDSEGITLFQMTCMQQIAEAKKAPWFVIACRIGSGERPRRPFFQ